MKVVAAFGLRHGADFLISLIECAKESAFAAVLARRQRLQLCSRRSWRVMVDPIYLLFEFRVLNVF